MHFTYRPQGTCSYLLELDIDGDTVQEVQIVGGCSGNGQGVSSLVKGMKVDEVIARLDGIKCGFKPTSCPDQLAQALKKYKEEKAK